MPWGVSACSNQNQQSSSLSRLTRQPPKGCADRGASRLALTLWTEVGNDPSASSATPGPRTLSSPRTPGCGHMAPRPVQTAICRDLLWKEKGWPRAPRPEHPRDPSPTHSSLWRELPPSPVHPSSGGPLASWQRLPGAAFTGNTSALWNRFSPLLPGFPVWAGPWAAGAASGGLGSCGLR